MTTKTKPTASQRPGRPRQPDRPDVDRALSGLTRAQIVNLIGCGASTFDRWRAEGLPQRPDGLFDVGAILRWAREVWIEAKRAADGSRDGVEQLSRLRAVRTAREALALQRDRAAVMPRAEIVEEWAKRCFAFRSASLALPRILASRCANSPADVVEREAMAIMREMLLQFVRRAERTPTPTGFEEHIDSAQPVAESHPPHTSAGTSSAPSGKATGGT